MKRKVRSGEAMTISVGKAVKQVELSSEYVKKLASKRRRREEGEDEEDEGVNFYDTKRVVKRSKEEMEIQEGRRLELNVQ